MANPWDNDPLVDEPWAADPIVDDAPRTRRPVTIDAVEPPSYLDAFGERAMELGHDTLETGRALKKTIPAAAKNMMAGVGRGLADLSSNMQASAAESYARGPVSPQQQAAVEGATQQAFESDLRSGQMGRTASRASIEGEEAIPEDAGAIQKGVIQGLTSAALATPAVLMGGPVGGAAALGVGTAGSRYTELVDKGVPRGTAAKSAMMMGSLEGLTEFLPGKALVKNVPSFWGRVAEFMASELPGENINSIAQIIDDYRLQLRDDVTKDDIMQALQDTTLATLIGGGAQAGAAQLLQDAVTRANSAQPMSFDMQMPELIPQALPDPNAPAWEPPPSDFLVDSEGQTFRPGEDQIDVQEAEDTALTGEEPTLAPAEGVPPIQVDEGPAEEVTMEGDGTFLPGEIRVEQTPTEDIVLESLPEPKEEPDAPAPSMAQRREDMLQKREALHVAITPDTDPLDVNYVAGEGGHHGVAVGGRVLAWFQNEETARNEVRNVRRDIKSGRIDLQQKAAGEALEYPTVRAQRNETEVPASWIRDVESNKRITRPSFYSEDMEGMVPRDAKKVKSQGGITYLFSEETGNFYAKKGNKTVGYVALMDNDETDVTVANDFQRLGIGTELLRQYFAKYPNAKTGGLTEAGAALVSNLNKGNIGNTYETDTGTSPGTGEALSLSESQQLQQPGGLRRGVDAPKGTVAARPLDGLPAKQTVAGRGEVTFGPHQPAHDAAAAYAKEAGIDYKPVRAYKKVDVPRAQRISSAYQEMPHAPQDPKVKASYDAMIKETVAQYQAVKKTGLKIEAIEPGMPDPYAKSPRLAILDVTENNHLWFYPTDVGFGGPNATLDVSDNPLLAPTGEKIGDRELLANDVFRIVHDYFGHIKDGVGFRADGEENAWRSHATMYSPLARGAMTSETRGQNSWLNFGPYGEKNRTASAAETEYAEQKTGLLPEEFWRLDEEDTQEQPEKKREPRAQRTEEAKPEPVKPREREVRAEINLLLKGYRIRPPLTVVQSWDQLPARVKHFVTDEDVRAFMLDDRMYVIADRVPSIAALATTVQHEVTVHYGLRAVMTEEEMNTILDGVARDNPMELRRRGRQEYGTKFDPNNDAMRRHAAEEVLAYHAQNYLAGEKVADRIKRWIDKMIAAIRDWARGNNLKYDDRWMKRFVQDLQKRLKSRTADSVSFATPTAQRGGAFDRWFAGSKVVDKDGQPLVVYHGTSEKFDVFDFGYSQDLGAHFGTLETAKEFEGEGVPLMAVYLRIKNPLRMPDFQGWIPEVVAGWLRSEGVITHAQVEEIESMQDDDAARGAVVMAIEAAGFDGVVYENEHEGSGDSYIVFHPEQIKSAIGNRGTYDPSNPDITAQRAAPVYFSALTLAAETAKRDKGTANEWLGTLRNMPGVKPEEIQWSGLEEWINSLNQRVTKQEVVDFLQANQIQVQDVLHGEDALTSNQERRMQIDGMLVDLTAHGFHPDATPDINSPMMADMNDGSRWQYVYSQHEWIRVDAPELTDEMPPELRDLATEYAEARRQQLFDEGSQYGDAAPELATRYDRYTTPGGENYRELLLTLPSRADQPFYETGADGWVNVQFHGISRRMPNMDAARAWVRTEGAQERRMEAGGDYVSSHWSEPNILAHVRFNERTDADGKRVLFIEEIQSDFGQATRKARDRLNAAIDSDFESIVFAMEADGFLKKECD